MFAPLNTLVNEETVSIEDIHNSVRQYNQAYDHYSYLLDRHEIVATAFGNMVSIESSDIPLDQLKQQLRFFMIAVVLDDVPEITSMEAFTDAIKKGWEGFINMLRKAKDAFFSAFKTLYKKIRSFFGRKGKSNDKKALEVETNIDKWPEPADPAKVLTIDLDLDLGIVSMEGHIGSYSGKLKPEFISYGPDVGGQESGPVSTMIRSIKSLGPTLDEYQRQLDARIAFAKKVNSVKSTEELKALMENDDEAEIGDPNFQMEVKSLMIPWANDAEMGFYEKHISATSKIFIKNNLSETLEKGAMVDFVNNIIVDPKLPDTDKVSKKLDKLTSAADGVFDAFIKYIPEEDMDDDDKKDVAQMNKDGLVSCGKFLKDVLLYMAEFENYREAFLEALPEKQ